MPKPRIEIEVTSNGVKTADASLKQLNATAKETEKQKERLARAAEKAAERQAKVAEKEAAAAIKATQQLERRLARENEQWNDALQKAIARDEKRAQAAERAAKREEEAWNRAIQRAKAGLDGVLPIRPSLQRIEAQVNGIANSSQQTALAGIAGGVKMGGLQAAGLGALAGGAASIAAMAVEKLASSLRDVKKAMVESMVEDANLTARLGALTSSAEEAGDTLSDIKRMTFDKLPSTVKETADAFIYLGNVGLDNSASSMKAYSNIAAQTGKSITDLGRVVLGATTGEFEALKGLGIKAKVVGDELSLNFRGNTTLISNDAESIQKYLLDIGKVEFAGAVERQMDTIGGTLKRTDDAWAKLIDTINDSRIGDLIQAGVGAAIPFIDAMTVSIDALFGKIKESKRELESIRREKEEQDKLWREMASWGAPEVSKSEMQRLADELERNAQSSADKALARYTKNAALIDKLESLGEEQVGDMTLQQARDELLRQYTRDSGGGQKQPANVPVVLFDANVEAQMAYEDRMRDQAQREKEAYARKIEELKKSLAKAEDAEYASYTERRQLLAKYLGPDSEELLARNEDLWSKHLDEVAEKAALKQLALQRKLASIGVGPQSQVQSISNKYAGQRFELEQALAENMSGKNGQALRLEAEQTYSEKSIAIEKARIKEIEALNRGLVEQSTQNAALIFGGLADVMKNAHGEQSKEYQAMFAIQQGFGIASATASMYIAMANANQTPYPANIPLYIKAVADGTRLLAQISSLSYSGSYDNGGYIPAGSYGNVAEMGRAEIVDKPTKIRGPAHITGSRDTAAALRGGNTTIVVAPDSAGAAQFMRSRAGDRAHVALARRNSTVIRRF